MKRSLLFLALICFTLISPASAQDPEPACACDQPEFVVELGGKLKLNYKEMNICTMDDGSLLLQDRDNDNYYIVKGGAIQGPFAEEDPRIGGYEDCYLETQNQDDLIQRYKGILTRTGNKYTISFGGKTYGPFIDLVEFVVSRSKNNFAAIAYEREGEMPKLFTNVPNATFDIINTINASLSGNIKYDDILVLAEDRVINLQGKTLYKIKPEREYYNVFLNTSNDRVVYYDPENIMLNENSTLSEIFNPHLLKVGNTVYLAYMYYSPKRKAIMQCKIPF